jgi:hypothetical protein
MNEHVRKLTVMINSNVPIEEIKAYHKVHGMDMVNEILHAKSTPEGEAAFEAELKALIKATREANGLPPLVKQRSKEEG